MQTLMFETSKYSGPFITPAIGTAEKKEAILEPICSLVYQYDRYAVIPGAIPDSKMPSNDRTETKVIGVLHNVNNILHIDQQQTIIGNQIDGFSFCNNIFDGAIECTRLLENV
ncbi:hypothetical protein AYI69_g66 [Smittium culicis]|uniref:Uncharacterized protein n=1 Tax=Smittium culicis TaxID=133412 RepID=A0A1R1YU34_9FUNG|nr:hypothetical protein AYI69_g66 [Smittium culicis]